MGVLHPFRDGRSASSQRAGENHTNLPFLSSSTYIGIKSAPATTPFPFLPPTNPNPNPHPHGHTIPPYPYSYPSPLSPSAIRHLPSTINAPSVIHPPSTIPRPCSFHNPNTNPPSRISIETSRLREEKGR